MDELKGKLEAIVDRVIAEVDEGALVLIACAADAASDAAPPKGGRLDSEVMERRMLGADSGVVPDGGESPAVRASRRRRNDSAAAAPAPVTMSELRAAEVEFDVAVEADVDGERRATGDAGEVATAARVSEWSRPRWRSATLRATKPTNGDRADPPGSVVTRSTVAVRRNRGPVCAETARRTVSRRRTDSPIASRVDGAAGDVVTTESERNCVVGRAVGPRRVGVERPPSIVEGRDDRDTFAEGELDAVAVLEDEPRMVVAGVRLVVALDTDPGFVERDDKEVDDEEVDDVERDGERRIAARDDADSSAAEATCRRSETRAAAADSRPPLTGERRTRSPGRPMGLACGSAKRATRSARVGGVEFAGSDAAVPATDESIVEKRRIDATSGESFSPTDRRHPGALHDISTPDGQVVSIWRDT